MENKKPNHLLRENLKNFNKNGKENSNNSIIKNQQKSDDENQIKTSTSSPKRCVELNKKNLLTLKRKS